MEAKKTFIEQSLTFQGCPHFGLREDATTKILFPSPIAACHITQDGNRIDLTYQEHYCLSDNHLSCPFFERHIADAAPQSAIAVDDPWFSRLPQRGVRIGALAIGILFVLLLIAWTINSNANLLVLAQPSASETPTPQATKLQNKSAGEVAIISLDPTKTTRIKSSLTPIIVSTATAHATVLPTETSFPPASPSPIPSSTTVLPTATVLSSAIISSTVEASPTTTISSINPLTVTTIAKTSPSPTAISTVPPIASSTAVPTRVFTVTQSPVLPTVSPTATSKPLPPTSTPGPPPPTATKISLNP